MRSARLHRKAAQAWLTDQRSERASAHLRAAESLAPVVAADEAARRLAVQATWFWQRRRYEEAQAAAEESVRTARASGAADAVVLAHETLAIVLHFRGAWREGLHAAIDRIGAGDPTAQLATVSEIHCCIGQYHLYGDGLSGSVEDYARRTLDLATARGARRAEAFAWCLLGESLLLQGRWDESEACLQRAAELHAEFGPGAGVLSWQRLAELATCRGDSATAQSCLRRAMAIATVAPLAQHVWGRLFAIAALDAVERGDPYGAIRAAHSAAAAGARYGDCADCGVLLNPAVAEAYATIGDPAGAAHVRPGRGGCRRPFRQLRLARDGRERRRFPGAGGRRRRDRAGPPSGGRRALRPGGAAVLGRPLPDAGGPRRSSGGRVSEADRRLLDDAAATFERLGALRALRRARLGLAGGDAPVTGGAPVLPPVEDLHVPAGPGYTRRSSGGPPGNGGGTPPDHGGRHGDIELIATPALGDNSYLLVSGDEAAVVDPQRDAWPLVEATVDRALSRALRARDARPQRLRLRCPRVAGRDRCDGRRPRPGGVRLFPTCRWSTATRSCSGT